MAFGTDSIRGLAAWPQAKLDEFVTTRIFSILETLQLFDLRGDAGAQIARQLLLGLCKSKDKLRSIVAEDRGFPKRSEPTEDANTASKDSTGPSPRKDRNGGAASSKLDDLLIDPVQWAELTRDLDFSSIDEVMLTPGLSLVPPGA